jgi:hypothetical protein
MAAGKVYSRLKVWTIEDELKKQVGENRLEANVGAHRHVGGRLIGSCFGRGSSPA